MIAIMYGKVGHFTLCGIAVILSKSSKDSVPMPALSQMLRTMAHRGPDGEGVYRDAEIALGMRRLAIVGGEGGSQPIFNADDSIALVCNGEIYNYRALKMMLERDGAVFRTTSDVEVIVHLYERHGKKCVEYLQGIFAFALWDSRKKSLFVARDQVGVKPLYYVDTGSHLMFASEMRALLAVQLEPVRFDARSFSAYHTFRYVPLHRTLVHGIQKVRPGQYMQVTLSAMTTGYYWRPRVEKVDINAKTSTKIKTLRELLQSAVQSQLAPGVSSGILLSGGLDSSALLAMHREASGAPPDTYTVCFSPPRQAVAESEYSELRYASLVANTFGARNVFECYTASEALESLPQVISALDEPVADPTAIPLWFATKLARQNGCKVVFSGEGLDELFNGYEAYRQTHWIRGLNRFPKPILATFAASVSRMNLPGQGVLHRSLAPLWSWYQGIGGTFTEVERTRLFREDILPYISAQNPQMHVEEITRTVRDESHLRQMTWFDVFGWLPENTLVKSDKISMSHSVELRVPFLDRRVVEYALGLDDRMKLRGKVGKWVVKRAFADILPASVRERPKAGFAVPLTAWMFHEWRDVAMSTLLDVRSKTRVFYRPEEVERLFNVAMPQKRRAARLLWSLLTFEIWCQKALQNTSVESTSFASRPFDQRHRGKDSPFPEEMAKFRF